MTSYPTMPNGADHVLVASPSNVIRQRVLDSLRSPARCFEQASGGAEALVHLESGLWHVLYLDRHLPDLDAEELSQTVRQRFPGVEIVLLDADLDGKKEDDRAAGGEMVDLVPEGWPAPANAEWAGDTDNRAKSTTVASLPGMIGDSQVMQPVYRLARLLAPRNTTVLITGPTGSGKEIMARAIHQLSPRSGRAFAVVNCAAIPETMLEAELFGYARGAFTGATQSYAG